MGGELRRAFPLKSRLAARASLSSHTDAYCPAARRFPPIATVQRSGLTGGGGASARQIYDHTS